MASAGGEGAGETGAGGMVGAVGALQTYLDLLAQQFPAMASDLALTELQGLLGGHEP